MLQEYVQKRHMGQIAYVLTGSSGPDHNKVFNMDVTVAGVVVGGGDGNQAGGLPACGKGRA